MPFVRLVYGLNSSGGVVFTEVEDDATGRVAGACQVCGNQAVQQLEVGSAGTDGHRCTGETEVVACCQIEFGSVFHANLHRRKTAQEENFACLHIVHRIADGDPAEHRVVDVEVFGVCIVSFGFVPLDDIGHAGANVVGGGEVQRKRAVALVE